MMREPYVRHPKHESGVREDPMNRTFATILAVLAVGIAAGFYLYSRSMVNSPSTLLLGEVTQLPRGAMANDRYGSVNPTKISFIDVAETNSNQDVPVSELTLLNEDLENVVLSDLQNGENLLLVVLRGAPLCPFCTAQTSRLVSNYQSFKDLGSEVSVVFPGSRDDLKQLLTKASLDGQELPFPILVDTDLSAIERLDISGDKAMPSTFIIDRKGRTQFAYVGASNGDRPSIKAILTALGTNQAEKLRQQPHGQRSHRQNPSGFLKITKLWPPRPLSQHLNSV